MVYGNLNLLNESYEIIQEKALPKDLKFDVQDIINASRFKTKVQKIVKFYEDNNAKEKKLSSKVKQFYFYVLGNTFYSNEQKTQKYQPKIAWLTTYFNKYCTDKDRKTIKTDIKKTIDSLDKLKKSKELNDLQKAWYDDIKSAISKIK